MNVLSKRARAGEVQVFDLAAARPDLLTVPRFLVPAPPGARKPAGSTALRLTRPSQTRRRTVSTAILPFTGTYDIDRTHSSVHFAVAHIVSTFRASFDDVEGHLVAGDAGTTLEAGARVESLSIV